MIRFINAKRIEEKLQIGEKPVFVDICPEASFQKNHPRGAINLPLERLKEEKFVRSCLSNPAKDVILFSENYENEPAWEAAEALNKLGYANLYIYEGGKSKWVEDGQSFSAVHYPPEPAEPGHGAKPPTDTPNVTAPAPGKTNRKGKAA